MDPKRYNNSLMETKDSINEFEDFIDKILSKEPTKPIMLPTILTTAGVIITLYIAILQILDRLEKNNLETEEKAKMIEAFSKLKFCKFEDM